MSAQHGEEGSATDWTLACKQRALVYGWFSTLYETELSDAALKAYLAGEAAPLLGGLCALGLDAEVGRFQAALEGLRNAALARLELAADFAQLFLLDLESGAPPYASVYAGDDPQFCGAAETQMRQILAAAALSIDTRFREPADHLAVYLALMRHKLEGHTAAREQVAFLDDTLLTWLPTFVERNQRSKPQFDLYPALAALLLAFVERDALYLRDVALQVA